MKELNQKYENLKELHKFYTSEIKELITKGYWPGSDELSTLACELGKVVYALEVLREIKRDFENNQNKEDFNSEHFCKKLVDKQEPSQTLTDDEYVLIGAELVKALNDELEQQE